MDVAGAVAVVTGGAGAIGQAVARRLRAAGATVVVWDVRGGGDTVHCDVSDPAEVASAMAVTLRNAGVPTILVATAAVSVGMAPVAGPDADWDAVLTAPADWKPILAINLVGTMLCVRTAGQAMIEHDRPGSIVTISSVNGGPIAEPGFAAYSCAKAGVDMLTRIAAAEFGPFGIRVNSVAPGVLAHPLAAATSPRSAGARPTGLAEAVAARTPVQRRLGSAEDIADVVHALISAGWVTGQVLTADGGLTLTSPIGAAGSAGGPGSNAEPDAAR